MSGQSRGEQSPDLCVVVNQLKHLYKMMASDSTQVGMALIAIAAIIAVVSIGAIIYHCHMWSRFV